MKGGRGGEARKGIRNLSEEEETMNNGWNRAMEKKGKDEEQMEKAKTNEGIEQMERKRLNENVDKERIERG